MALRKGAQLFGSRLLQSASSSIGSLSTVPAVLSEGAQPFSLADAAQFGQQRRETVFIIAPALLRQCMQMLMPTVQCADLFQMCISWASRLTAAVFSTAT